MTPEERALRVPAPCVCVDMAFCNQHKAIVEQIRAAIHFSVAEEREACARIAEEFQPPPYDVLDQLVPAVTWNEYEWPFVIAARIRARAEGARP